MTVSAAPFRTHARRCATSLLVFAAAAAVASPAAAEIGAAVSVFSDYRYRGYSLSEGRPVGILDLSFDEPGGFYGAVSASVVAARGEGPKPLGMQLNAGYARRLRSGLTADFGVVHSTYSHYSGVRSGPSSMEIYAGIAGRSLSSRLSFSPNYLGTGAATVHGEVNGNLNLASNLRVNGQVGGLLPLGSYHGSREVGYDARLGLDRSFGRFSLHAAVTSRGGGLRLYSGHGSARHAFIVGLSCAL